MKKIKDRIKEEEEEEEVSPSLQPPNTESNGTDTTPPNTESNGTDTTPPNSGDDDEDIPPPELETETELETELEAGKRITVTLRHKTEYPRYRRAGLVLSQKAQSYELTEAQLAALKKDKWVVIEGAAK
jgi:hypothetical protein